MAKGLLKITKRIAWDLKDVPNGHPLIVKRWFDYEAESWLTSLDLPGEELIKIPARILTGSNQLKLDIGRDLPGREAFLALYQSLASPA